MKPACATPPAPGYRAVLPVQPLADLVTAAAAVIAFAVVHLGLEGSAAAAVAVAVAAAAVVSITWPRFATDTLRLHGSVFPIVPGPGDAWLFGRWHELAAAVAGRRACFLYASWRARAAAPNFQVWTAGTRRVVLTHPEDVGYVLARACPPRDVDRMRVFGLPISPRVLILSQGATHAATRRLLAGPLADARVLDGGIRGLLTDVADEGGAVGGVLAAAADAGIPADMAVVAELLTLRVIHRVMVSAPPPPDNGLLHALQTLLPLLLPAAVVPFPHLFLRGRVARIRAVGRRFVDSLAWHEAARRAAYADGSARQSPPGDLLDVFLADVDAPGGTYGGDRVRLAADYMALMVAGFDTTVRGGGGRSGRLVDWKCCQVGYRGESRRRSLTRICAVLCS